MVRAFELWTHEEDIRRATGRPVADPDAATLSRMTGLATALLPAGVARAGRDRPGPVRLVLTGPGGGTWDVGLAGGVSRAEPGRTFDTHVVVDAAGSLPGGRQPVHARGGGPLSSPAPRRRPASSLPAPPLWPSTDPGRRPPVPQKMKGISILVDRLYPG